MLASNLNLMTKSPSFSCCWACAYFLHRRHRSPCIRGVPSLEIYHDIRKRTSPQTQTRLHAAFSFLVSCCFAAIFAVHPRVFRLDLTVQGRRERPAGGRQHHEHCVSETDRCGWFEGEGSSMASPKPGRKILDLGISGCRLDAPPVTQRPRVDGDV